MRAMAATKRTAKAPTTEQPSLAEIGRTAAKAAQRKALLAALRRHGWNLAAAGADMQVGGSANVIRAIHTLGLTAEYDAARVKRITKT